jgi:DNA polymerase-3 subunit epsilon
MSFSLLQPLRDTPIAVLDVETTGASADFGHRVIELGIVRVEGGRVVAEYQQLIDPQRRISPGVTALTGISQAMCTDQPTFTDQLPAALGLLRGALVMGHNVRFDLSFLRKEFRRAGQDITAVLGEKVPVLDTVRIARRRFGRGGNALQILSRRLGIEPTVAHRALADAQTTAAVFERLIEPVGGWSLCLCDAMKEQGGPMGLLPASPRESLLPLELEEALEQRGAVLMEYLDARQKRTQRVIEPVQIRRSNGELLLIAHCQLRNDRRTFKLDRIVQLTKVERGAPVMLSVGVEHVPCDQPVAPETADASNETTEPSIHGQTSHPARREVDPHGRADREPVLHPGSVSESEAGAGLPDRVRLPGVHERVPGDGPAGLRDDHDTVRAGPALRGDEEPEALLFRVPEQGDLLRSGDEHDPG